jgi:hypothetical protein
MRIESVPTTANKHVLLSCLFSPANGDTNKGYLVKELTNSPRHTFFTHVSQMLMAASMA